MAKKSIEQIMVNFLTEECDGEMSMWEIILGV